MSGLILQHSVNGPPGRFAEWLRERGIPFAIHHSWEVAPALDPRDYAFVAMTGSAHSVNQAQPAWIPTELAFIRAAVAAGTPVLGLCWGGQALSVALGGIVTRAALPEKGWLPITSSDPEIPDGPWAHYHSEVFTVPAGATELARSPAGPAAFRHGPHLGLQFHPEADDAIVGRWAQLDVEQTDAGRARLAREARRFSAAARPRAFAMFDAWWARTGVS